MSSDSSSDGTYDSLSESVSSASDISSIPSLTAASSSSPHISVRRTEERRGDVRTRFSRYSDGAHLSPRDGRQLAERVAQSGPTFSLESSGGLIEGMFCGPTYLIV